MKAIEDSRTLNKIVHFRPPCNYLNINELAALWEKKIGKSLPRVTVSEDDLLAIAAGQLLNCLQLRSTQITRAYHQIYGKLFSENGRLCEDVKMMHILGKYNTVDKNDAHIGQLKQCTYRCAYII